MGRSAFEVVRSVDLPTDPQAAFDYLSNPNSWLEWLHACEAMDAENRPHGVGETFCETYRVGDELLKLDWRVVRSDPPRLWEVHTSAEITGPVEVRYEFEPQSGGCRFTRCFHLPSLPKPPAEEQKAALAKEAGESLKNIKSILTRAT